MLSPQTESVQPSPYAIDTSIWTAQATIQCKKDDTNHNTFVGHDLVPNAPVSGGGSEAANLQGPSNDSACTNPCTPADYSPNNSGNSEVVLLVDTNGSATVATQVHTESFMPSALSVQIPQWEAQEATEFGNHDVGMECWQQGQHDDPENSTDGETTSEDDDEKASMRERAERFVMHCLRNPKLLDDATKVVSPQEFVSIGAWDLADVWRGLKNIQTELGIEAFQGGTWPQLCEHELRNRIKRPPNVVSFVFGNEGFPGSGLLQRAFTPPAAEFPESHGRWLLSQFCTGSLLVKKLQNVAGMGHVASKDPAAYISHARKVLDDYEKLGLGQASKSLFMTPEEFAKATFKLEWLVPNILVAGQPCIAGGPAKGMKTSLMIELAVSLGVGNGCKFLGHFSVKEPGIRVGFISGESGGASIKSTFERVCQSKQVELAKCNVFPEFRLPKLGDAKELRALASQAKDKGLKVLIIDPIYLSLLAGASNVKSTDMLQMGPLLASVAEALLEAGATPILVHHTVKHLRPGDRDGRFEPIEREDLAQSGFAEFARQWLLINRRARYEEGSGKHALWLGVGGSAGFSSTWAVDIDEGVLKEDFSGRTWVTRVVPRAKHEVELAQQKAMQKQADTYDAIQQGTVRLIQVFKLHPQGETKAVLLAEAGLRGSKYAAVIWADLFECQAIQPVQIAKPNGKGTRLYDGWKLTDPQTVACPRASTLGN